jgi:hypothetical protein
MEYLAQLLAALKQATQMIRELRVAWWLVAAALVSAIALQLFGSGRAAILAVSLSMLGLVLSLIVSALAREASTGRASLVRPAKVLVWAVVLFLLSFLVLTLLAVMTCQPYPWARFLVLECSVPQVGVHIDRTIDATDSGCTADRKRFYNEVITDTLTFSEPIAAYTLQAKRDPVSGMDVQIEYVVNGERRQAITPFVEEFGGVQRTARKVPVNGRNLVVIYRWRQTPPRDAKNFGPAFISSLPILSIRAEATLPPGKTVLRLNEDEKARISQVASAGCDFKAGQKPQLLCTEKQVTFGPNEPFIVPWVWDVFDGC